MQYGSARFAKLRYVVIVGTIRTQTILGVAEALIPPYTARVKNLFHRVETLPTGEKSSVFGNNGRYIYVRYISKLFPQY